MDQLTPNSIIPIPSICYFTTEDSITLYWDKPYDFQNGDYYEIYFDQKTIYNTEKTHFEIDGLTANTSYFIQIQWMRTESSSKSIYCWKLTLETKQKKQVIDISKAPYFAIGDGKTMNTNAIQAAIDNCDENTKVYFPKGIYKTGALRLHSNMELYLDSDAVLQGTDEPDDYLPKIPSRFEGIEQLCYSSLLNLGNLDHNSGFNCVFYTGDDSISIKSGKNPEGNQINRPCKNIRIFDCQTAFGHGITIGSEMSGGIENISIWDCNMSCSMYGIEIKGTKKRGGYVRNIHVRDCSVSRILFHSVSYNDDGISAGSAPVFEACRFENLHILGKYMEEDEWFPCQAIELSGFEQSGHALQNITFDHIILGYPEQKQKQTIALEYFQDVTFRNISSYDHK